MAGLTPEQARDYILDKFKIAWDTNSPIVNGGIAPDVEYDNLTLHTTHLSKGNKSWARATVRHSSGEQRSFGIPGTRIFTRRGLFTIQIFIPAGKQGLVLADRLGKVVINALEGEETSTGDVWFRNVTYREIGIDGNWFQVNVSAEFEYDAVK